MIIKSTMKIESLTTEQNILLMEEILRDIIEGLWMKKITNEGVSICFPTGDDIDESSPVVWKLVKYQKKSYLIPAKYCKKVETRVLQISLDGASFLKNDHIVFFSVCQKFKIGDTLHFQCDKTIKNLTLDYTSRLLTIKQDKSLDIIVRTHEKFIKNLYIRDTEVGTYFYNYSYKNLEFDMINALVYKRLGLDDPEKFKQKNPDPKYICQKMLNDIPENELKDWYFITSLYITC